MASVGSTKKASKSHNFNTLQWNEEGLPALLPRNQMQTTNYGSIRIAVDGIHFSTQERPKTSVNNPETSE
jgi:hypothetical protein